MSEATEQGSPRVSGFKIFRAADAPDIMQAGCMSVEPFTPLQSAGLERMMDAGYRDGDEGRVLVNIPGFSLVHIWFKKDFPLPLHTHDVDCLYYIIAGGLHFGTEQLGPRDSFFIPAGMPYTYRPGVDGVEVLEFRTVNAFNFVNLANGEGFWTKAAETCAANREAWKAASPPSLSGQH